MSSEPMEFEFERQSTFERRAQDCERILKRYPQRVPVICERLPRSPLPQLASKKFLVPSSMTMSQLAVVVKNQLEKEDNHGMKASSAIYFTLRNMTACRSTHKMEDLYKAQASGDGFLYVFYSEEQVFG